jgi:hypothetical protein
MTAPAPDAISRRFRVFADAECRGSSPLYERLSYGVADDPDLVALAAHGRPGQPLPNLFFAAVRYLLRAEPSHPLASFYPSLSPIPNPGDPLPAFRHFCLAHAGAMRDLLATRLVQTNEVRRSACLLPAFGLVAARAPGRPLALLEIGPSAGLNLLPDRYGFHYSDGRRAGDPASPVQLACELRGPVSAPIPETVPAIGFRLGIDLNPVDVRDADAVAWLRALVWPEHRERAALLDAALAVARREPPRLLAGDALDRLPDALATIPPGLAVCVFHSMVLNQFTPEARGRLAAILLDHGRARDIYRVSLGDLFTEGVSLADGPRPMLRLLTYHRGAVAEETFARCDPHGSWIEWRGAA